MRTWKPAAPGRFPAWVRCRRRSTAFCRPVALGSYPRPARRALGRLRLREASGLSSSCSPSASRSSRGSSRATMRRGPARAAWNVFSLRLQNGPRRCSAAAPHLVSGCARRCWASRRFTPASRCVPLRGRLGLWFRNAAIPPFSVVLGRDAFYSGRSSTSRCRSGRAEPRGRPDGRVEVPLVDRDAPSSFRGSVGACFPSLPRGPRRRWFRVDRPWPGRGPARAARVRESG